MSHTGGHPGLPCGYGIVQSSRLCTAKRGYWCGTPLRAHLSSHRHNGMLNTCRSARVDIGCVVAHIGRSATISPHGRQHPRHLRHSESDISSFLFANPGDLPILGDWNGNGEATPGLYRQVGRVLLLPQLFSRPPMLIRTRTVVTRPAQSVRGRAGIPAVRRCRIRATLQQAVFERAGTARAKRATAGIAARARELNRALPPVNERPRSSPTGSLDRERIQTRILVMTKVLPLTEVKARLSEMIDEIATTHERVTVTRNGRPVAVLVSTDDLETIEETLALLSDPAAMREIEEGRAAINTGDIVSQGEIEALRDRLRSTTE